ncbi:MAG: hypothetical protein L6V95_00155 [Candidatus Melainabacteria bacterium]|nr:MAG: hypothetical protein L6V95_00155 [Candidatus Melainabacteria bacterium]
MRNKITDTEEASLLAKSARNFYTTDVIKKTTKFTNQQILDLCKNGIVQPKKTLDGKIYFTKDDFSVMQKLSKAHEELGLLDNDENIDKPFVEKKEKPDTPKFEIKPKIKLPKLSQKTDNTVNKNSAVQNAQIETNNNLNIKEFESSIINKMEELLTKKLDGLDEVVVELIRTKTEINMLRSKLDEMEAKNYTLSNEVNSYKNIGFGLYIKSKEDMKN